MLKVENLNLTYDNENYVLENINFEVEKGEIIGIIGLSGAGKSSLLKTLNYLQKPTNGKILLNNTDLSRLNKKQLRLIRKKISVVFQNYNLLSYKNVFDNISFIPKLEKMEKNLLDKKVKGVAEKLSLSHRLNAYPSELSGGEKQRTAIARAIINNPEILLLDEPTSALDPKTTEKILDLILNINTEYNISTIVVTHEMDVIKKICDKVLYLKDGKVQYFGEVHKFFIEKENEIYKEFYEEINIDWNLIKEKLNKNSNLLKLTFYGQNTHDPILNKISKKYNISFNILYGKIEHLKKNLYGTLIIEVEKNEKTIEFIKDLEKNIFKCSIIE